MVSDQWSEGAIITGDPKNMTCAEFQALIPELLNSGEDATLHAHAQGCEQCRLFLIDLETISEAARKLFPGGGPLAN